MYYSIRHSMNTKIVGKFFQSEKIAHNYGDIENPKFLNNIYFEKVDFEPIVPIPILHKKAKITDLISNVNAGGGLQLVISDKLKKIIEKYRTKGLQFFKTSVIKDDMKYDNYFSLNVYEINLELIDFHKSKIYETKHTFDLERDLKIESYEHFNQVKNEINFKGYPFGILIKEIVLKSEHDFDFFALLNVEGGVKYIASEKLKQEIEDAGCTGIEFQPIELSYNEWIAPSGEREKVYGKA